MVVRSHPSTLPRDLLEKTAEEMEDVADEEGQEIEYEELLSDDE